MTDLASVLSRSRLLYRISARRPEHDAPDYLAILEVGQRRIGFGQRTPIHRYEWQRRGADEVDQLPQLGQAAGIRALQCHGLDRDVRRRDGDLAAEQADHDELSAFGQAVDA